MYLFTQLFAVIVLLNLKIQDYKKERHPERYDQHGRPYQVSILRPKDRVVLLLMLAIWGVVVIQYVIWLFTQKHLDTPSGFLIHSVIVLSTLFFAAWFFFHSFRMVAPNPELPLPKGRIAMVVTRAPSEDFWTIVVPTLKGMLNQSYTGRYDVWMCDEKTNRDIRRWCKRHGVKISTREGKSDFHQITFPNRTKCKEGNLMYWYRNFVFGTDGNPDRYDFVLQLDADHVPSFTYLEEMLRPFADLKVGLVAAPSICDANTKASWTVRARMINEALFHGAMQAGLSNGFSATAIGSHYAVRVEALKKLKHYAWDEKKLVEGGIGPELAEDMSTSQAMAAAGFKTRFSLYAEAHGDGAVSLGDLIVQDLQWASSVMMLLLKWSFGYLKSKGMPWHVKGQYMFQLLWYPMLAGLTALYYIMPVLALMFHIPFINGDFIESMFQTGKVAVVTLLIVYFLKSRKVARPHNSKLLGWELTLFNLLRWPWVLYALAKAIIAFVRKEELSFKVTDKSKEGAKPLNLKIMSPYYGLVLVFSLFLIFGEAKEAAGYYMVAAGNAIAYFAAIVAVIWLHIRENYRQSGGWDMYVKYLVPNIRWTIGVGLILTLGLWHRVPEIIQIALAN